MMQAILECAQRAVDLADRHQRILDSIPYGPISIALKASKAVEYWESYPILMVPGLYDPIGTHFNTHIELPPKTCTTLEEDAWSFSEHLEEKPMQPIGFLLNKE